MDRIQLKKLKSYEISDELGNKIKKLIKRVKWYQWPTMTYLKLKEKLYIKLTHQEKQEWENIPDGIKEYVLMGENTNRGKQNDI